MEDNADIWQPVRVSVAVFQPQETPQEAMELLSCSWSLSALEVSKAIAPPLIKPVSGGGATLDDIAGENEEAAMVSGNPFSFVSSATSQLVVERIMSQSQEVSPLTSGRLSHSSGPLNGAQSCGSLTDSPPVSPSEMDEMKFPVKPTRGGGGPGASGKTIGRWLKDRRDKKKEESRAHNAQLHAAVSVAGVAAAVAAIAAATAASSSSGKDENLSKTDLAVASAATLVAAQCVEAAEAMGAERDHLASVVSSAVNVRTHGDIMTLTAAAATALRGAATLKARVLKEVWNIAAVTPLDKGLGNHRNGDGNFSGEPLPTKENNLNLLGLSNHQLLARGTELLKRTRKGDLHWKIVSIYINGLGQVMLKTKSRHVAGTFTKKKKNVVLDIYKDIQAWPGRHLLEEGEHRRYFGLRTAENRVIEFECGNQREYDMWTQGVSRLLAIVEEKKR